MAETLFFHKQGRNKGNERKVIIKTATLLVSKPPTKEKRIKIRIDDNLSTGKKSGMTDWISDGFSFVAQHHGAHTPDVEALKGYEIEFGDDHLFEKPVQAVKATLRNFVIDEQGEAEKKEVHLSYLVYAPYSDKLWRWCGAMGGEEIYAKFTQMAEPEEEEEDQPELELESEDPDVEEGDEDGDGLEDEDLEDDEEYDDQPEAS